MNLQEYNKVKDFKYIEYCDYLKEKYGIAKYNYFKPNWQKNNKVTRTNEGLICHHICEDKAIMLSDKKIAQSFPYEYQEANNLVYCNYLEHLLLHILICENPNPDFSFLQVGIGGVVNFLVPELNDVFSGFETSQEWRKKCYKEIIDYELTYFNLLKRFLKNVKYSSKEMLKTSFNDKFNLWKIENNFQLFEKIDRL